MAAGRRRNRVVRIARHVLRVKLGSRAKTRRKKKKKSSHEEDMAIRNTTHANKKVDSCKILRAAYYDHGCLGKEGREDHSDTSGRSALPAYFRFSMRIVRIE